MLTSATHKIAKRELKSFFFSPIAYIIIGLFLLIVGYLFFSDFFLQGRTDLRGFFTLIPLVFAFAIPAITMRMLSEEYKTNSFEILATQPVLDLDILLGKFLAASALVLVMVLPTVIYGITISFLGKMDLGPVICGYVGILFIGMTYCAVGIFTSALTENQIIAYFVAAVACFAFAFVDQLIFLFPRGMAGFIQGISTTYHFNNLTKGIIDSRDLLYFLSVCAIFLYGGYMVRATKK